MKIGKIQNSQSRKMFKHFIRFGWYIDRQKVIAKLQSLNHLQIFIKA